MKKIALIVLSIALSGCATEDLKRRQLERQGQSPQYIDGFAEGCPSGKVVVGDTFSRFTKNSNRFDSDSLYRQGWIDGFAACREEMIEARRSMGM